MGCDPKLKTNVYFSININNYDLFSFSHLNISKNTILCALVV